MAETTANPDNTNRDGIGEIAARTNINDISQTRAINPIDVNPSGYTPMHTSSEFLTFSFEVRDSFGNPISSRNGRTNAPISMVFTVNPSNFDRSYKKMVDRQQTRAGWVEYHGGDELDTINVSGVVSAFVDMRGALTSVQALAKDSHGWKEYEQLVALFRNNGNYYDRGKGMIYEAGNIILTYDEGVYKGIFENLSISESSDKPFSIDYNFSFIVEETLYKFRRPIVTNHGRLK